MTAIPTNFKIPKSCRHEYLLFLENEWIGIISPVPGKRQVRQAFKHPATLHKSDFLSSRSLDWIQESVEHLRHICEGNS